MSVSTSVLRRLNIEALLRHAFASGTFTAAEAMEGTSLTRATVLGLCDELTAAGWIEEVEDSRTAGLSRRGRPARRHRLRAGAGLVIGVDAGRSGYRAMAADLRGTVLATGRRELDPDVVDRELRISTVQELVREVREASASTAPLLVTVIGIPAPVDTHGRSPIEVGTFWRLMNSGFPEHLDGRVVVENDANLSALAEHGQHLEANMAALLVGERIGAGLIVDGRLLHGALGGAGEMRFLETVLQDDIGAEGVGSLARRWTLEGLAAGRESPLLAALPAEGLTAVDVFAAAQAGDELARDVLDRIGERIARIAAILVSLLGIERIVLAGAVASSLEPVLARAREVLPDIAYAPFPELVASGLGRDAVVRGAVEHALTRLREDPLELLERLEPLEPSASP
ncbi:ROK family protein [Brachybacterium tyrofermentans]|uniref:ROK family protein n=1 Tax=Brachybacterium tyrofermentans TaxID=47848 RepID=UPI003F92770D